jgi:sugar (pentulose or hexulose) kinase
MNDRVTLVGFDIGTTTLRAAFVDAHVANNAATQRIEFGRFVDRPGGETILMRFEGVKRCPR